MGEKFAGVGSVVFRKACDNTGDHNLDWQAIGQPRQHGSANCLYNIYVVPCCLHFGHKILDECDVFVCMYICMLIR
jgi:hypothetical protein